MKTIIKTLSLITIVGVAFLASCKKDDTPPPPPQVTSSKTSLAVVANATDTSKLTVVAPANLSTITATVDQGTATISNITGVGATAGTAILTYTAPDGIGNYTITVTVTDANKQIGTLTVGVAVTAKPSVNIPAGSISGSLVRNTTYIAQGSINVPAGQSLTIPDGVTIIFDGDGSQGAPEFSVSGNLYVLGTKAKPVYFTVPAAKQIASNIYGGLWGGLQAIGTAAEVVLQYANIEYAGAPAGASNVSTLAGIYSAGTSRYGFLFANTAGKLVMQNSRIAYTKDDGMRVLGGTILITNNFYESCGSTGGESLNIKSSTTGDVAYNVMYSSATNAAKISNVSGSSATPQTNINFYNNTIINGGFRQTATTAHGGSINYEKGARGQIYNNLIVNCKFGTRITTDADTVNIKVGYNFYYGVDSGISSQFYPAASWITTKGKKETSNDVAGGAGDNDPKFVNFVISPFSSTNAALTSSPSFIGTYDLHLQSASPALTKGKSSFTVGTSLTVNGVTYTIPAPSAYVGAYSTN